MHRITIKEVEEIAFLIAQEKFSFNESIPAFTTRFPSVLESCLETPFQTFDGKELYPTFAAKLSMLFYLMNKNHPFQNGNKRIAMTTLFFALYEAKKWIKVDTQTLYNFAVWVAESPPNAKEEVTEYIEKFIKTHMAPLQE
ncbi:death-on-curing family protein [Candidatus Velamenicoccus archaeovorus]|uniref:Death-on-curing family protein n=1 Tax=Velamenicoccus archaeovorus TaxID=1930593 RepID=A0A410P232_VELA1|nr:Fic family protein [Candidatus Velamenicoccus archaeovorus]QAT16239.1 death-on-curing family protein [Candidatus Velamenicoccus archaeovorus]